jgi:hypothetical protein
MTSRNLQANALPEQSLSSDRLPLSTNTQITTNEDCDNHFEHLTKNAYTIRISNIPRELSKQRFLDQLDSRFPDSTILTSSLAPAAATLNSSKYNTATVTLSNILPPGSFDVDESWPYIIDDEFYGLTPLSCPEEPKVE